MAADKLYIICGHGAGDPGSGGHGYNEADVVRLVGKKLKSLGGSKVELLDTSINWYKSGKVNADLAKKVGKNPVVELHLDAAGESAKGGHVIIKTGMTPDAYDNNLAALEKSYFPGRSEVLVKRSNLANINRAAIYGINFRLVELCFITNKDDITKLINNMDDFCKKFLGCFGIGVSTSTQGSTKEGWVKQDGKWWYRYKDGTYPKSKWLKLDTWYYFDSEGWALMNCWKKIGGKWYHFNSDCRMTTGWFIEKNKAYYLDPVNGDMVENTTKQIACSFDKNGALK